MYIYIYIYTYINDIHDGNMVHPFIISGSLSTLRQDTRTSRCHPSAPQKSVGVQCVTNMGYNPIHDSYPLDS